jgi:hypothetical protein
MRFLRLALRVLAAAALLGATACAAQRQGQAEPGEPGCVVAPNEGALLDEYAGDAVLALIPDGASGVGSVTRSKGCIRLNKEDVSDTSVTLLLTMTYDYDQPRLRQAYDPVATGHGWARDLPRQDQLQQPGAPFLAYCRVVRGVTSQLSVGASASMRVDVRPSNSARPVSPIWQETPGNIILTIAAVPRRPSCSAAAT